MTTPICEQLSERMPLVASNSAQWSASDASHLESCAECRSEWDLVQATSRLGITLEAPVNADTLAQAVLARVRVVQQAEVVRRRALRRLQVGLVAAAAVLVGVFFSMPSWFGSQKAAPPVAAVTVGENGFRLPLAELDDAGSTEIKAALRVLGTPLDGESTLEPFGTGELEDDDFARALRAMEG